MTDSSHFSFRDKKLWRELHDDKDKIIGSTFHSYVCYKIILTNNEEVNVLYRHLKLPFLKAEIHLDKKPDSGTKPPT